MDTTESRTFAARLADLLKHERHAMTDFLVALAEFDRRRGWITLGYANLFDFLCRNLRLSKGTAFYRQVAVGLIQVYPEVLEPLRDGRLCVTALHALSKAITPANRAEVLPRFFHVSKREAQELAAELAPSAVVPRRPVVTTVRTASASAAAPAAAPPRAPESLTFSAATSSQNSQPVGILCLEGVNEASTAGPAPRLTIEPLTATESRLHLTVSRAFLKKLGTVRLALSHSMPGADAEGILSAGLDLLLQRDAKRKGLVEKPRSSPATPEVPGAVYVPAAVRREVWKRDQGCCQFPLDGGGICGSKLRTELDHIQLRCRGGRPTVENLRVVCRFHNDLAARLDVGDSVMDRYTHNPKQPSLAGLLGDPNGG